MMFIYYLFYFENNTKKLGALMKESTKINTTTFAYIAKSNLEIYSTSIKTKRIDDLVFLILKIVLSSF